MVSEERIVDEITWLFEDLREVKFESRYAEILSYL